MAFNISKVKVWSAEVDDKAGSASAKLAALAGAGADLQWVLARRQPDKPGKGVVFVAPVEGPKVEDAARKAGFTEAPGFAALRVEGPNAPGLGARITEAVAKAGINLRGMSAAVIGPTFSLILAFDGAGDAERGLEAVKKVG